MTIGRTFIGIALSAVIATALAPTEASAWWREPDDAFGRLACWYSGGPFVKGPGPTFGYGWPSCEPEKYTSTRQHRRKRALRVRG